MHKKKKFVSNAGYFVEIRTKNVTFWSKAFYGKSKAQFGSKMTRNFKKNNKSKYFLGSERFWLLFNDCRESFLLISGNSFGFTILLGQFWHKIRKAFLPVSNLEFVWVLVLLLLGFTCLLVLDFITHINIFPLFFQILLT